MGRRGGGGGRGVGGGKGGCCWCGPDLRGGLRQRRRLRVHGTEAAVVAMVVAVVIFDLI